MALNLWDKSSFKTTAACDTETDGRTRGGKQLKKQKLRLSRRYPTEQKRWHSWGIWLIPKCLKRRNSKTREPLWSNDTSASQYTKMGGGGIKPSPTNVVWIQARGPEESFSMSAQQYTPAACPHTRQHRTVGSHEQRHWQTAAAAAAAGRCFWAYQTWFNDWEMHGKPLAAIVCRQRKWHVNV